ncbi:hypothetical protein D3C85_1834540 [compost metagenome]
MLKMWLVNLRIPSVNCIALKQHRNAVYHSRVRIRYPDERLNICCSGRFVKRDYTARETDTKIRQALIQISAY